MSTPADHDRAPESQSLHDLRPDLFGSGTLLGDSVTASSMLLLTPQMILHWAGRSAIFSHSMEAAHDLLGSCVRLGADPLHMDPVALLRKASVMPQLQWTHSAGGSAGSGVEWLRISPLGSALLSRDTPLLMSLAEIIVASSPPRNPNSAVVRIKSTDGPVDFDAWSFCARIGTHMPLDLLAQAFSIQPDDPRQELRMGKALCILLADRKMDLQQDNSVLRSATRRFLLGGSVPETNDLLSAGVDPAWVIGIVSGQVNPADQRALQRLIDAKLPLTPTQAGVVPPLHIAATAGNSPAVIALLEGGADPHAKDARGFTLEQAVHADDRQALIDVLRVWTARRFALEAMGLFNAFRSPSKMSMFRNQT